jgi:hypothetical protein
MTDLDGGFGGASSLAADFANLIDPSRKAQHSFQLYRCNLINHRSGADTSWLLGNNSR